MRAKADIGYHGVVSSISSSDMPTLSVVSEIEVKNFHQTLTSACMKTSIKLYMSSQSISISLTEFMKLLCVNLVAFS